jgi:hypothetical protein
MEGPDGKIFTTKGSLPGKSQWVLNGSAQWQRAIPFQKT